MKRNVYPPKLSAVLLAACFSFGRSFSPESSWIGTGAFEGLWTGFARDFLTQLPGRPSSQDGLVRNTGNKLCIQYLLYLHLPFPFSIARTGMIRLHEAF